MHTTRQAYIVDITRAGLWFICWLVGTWCAHVWNDGRSATVWSRQRRWSVWFHSTRWCAFPSLVEQRGSLNSKRGKYKQDLHVLFPVWLSKEAVSILKGVCTSSTLMDFSQSDRTKAVSILTLICAFRIYTSFFHSVWLSRRCLNSKMVGSRCSFCRLSEQRNTSEMVATCSLLISYFLSSRQRCFINCLNSYSFNLTFVIRPADELNELMR